MINPKSQAVEQPQAERDRLTEERILEAAHRVFVRRGTAGARTQEIADEAGVNKALLHYYFRSKERLAEAVFMRSARMLFPRMLRVFASDLPLRTKLENAVKTELELLEAHPFLPGYVLSELQYRPDRIPSLLSAVGVPPEQRKMVLFGLQTSIDTEVAGGRLRPTRPEELLLALMSLLIFPHVAAPMVQAVLGLAPAQREDMLSWRERELVDFLLRGLQPDR